MNTSSAGNIFGGYYHMTLEDLKAYILTEIDEETAV
jgi:hypothetical protein